MKKELLIEIEATAGELLQAINAFSHEEINMVPFEGSWTPGQVSEHLIKAAAGIARTVNGNTKPTERDPAQNVAGLRSAFLDFSKKMKSPDFILPGDAPQQKEKLLEGAADAMAKISTATDTLDLTETCIDFELPNSGQLTRLEWINFIICHTKRHIHQLKTIRGKMKLLANQNINN
ncbi:MAG: DinB family protein [Chitinophagaceae bacterium]